MLHARQHAIRPQRVSLESLHLRPRHRRTQVGILARTFHNPSPPRIPRNVHHRREGPVDPSRARILPSQSLRLLFHARIPRRRHRQRHRKYRPVAVNHVKRKQDWNMQPRFFHRDVLQPIDLLHVDQPQHRPHLPLADQIIGLLAPQNRHRHARRLVKLPNLLVHRHLLQQSLRLPMRLFVRHSLSAQASSQNHQSAARQQVLLQTRHVHSSRASLLSNHHRNLPSMKSPTSIVHLSPPRQAPPTLRIVKDAPLNSRL